jgi:hypothetical protein
VKAETLSIRPLPDYDARAVRIANEILARADRFDVAGTAFTMRHWVELQARLPFFAEEHGPLRILLWPDPARTSPTAIAKVLALEGAQVAFASGEPQFGATDFLISEGNEFTVLATSLRLLYPELCGDAEGGGMVQHARPDDAAAQKVVARFERCWGLAQLVDAGMLAAFRAKAEACATRFDEGDLVRSTEDLYEDYGVGRVQKLRGEHAKVEFNPSVFMDPPYRSENKLLQLAEMEKVDSPLVRATAGRWEEPWRFELKMLAARFLTGNKGGQLSNARTEILPHQIFAAHRVVSSVKRRFLLADEVGLGKTIEAGMIWQALEQRGQAKRTLIITPAGRPSGKKKCRTSSESRSTSSGATSRPSIHGFGIPCQAPSPIETQRPLSGVLGARRAQARWAPGAVPGGHFRPPNGNRALGSRVSRYGASVRRRHVGLRGVLRLRRADSRSPDRIPALGRPVRFSLRLRAQTAGQPGRRGRVFVQVLTRVRYG